MTAPSKAVPVFIDTNIWIYAFSDTQNKTKTQRSRALIRREQNIYLSTQVINEVTHNLLRKFDATEDVVRRLVRTMYRKYHVLEYTKDVYLTASQLRVAYSLSYWDSTIISSALLERITIGCTAFLITSVHPERSRRMGSFPKHPSTPLRMNG